MSEPIVRTLASVVSPVVGMPYDGVAGAHLFTATVTGAGAVSAAVVVEGSNDLVGWSLVAALNPSGNSGIGVASESTTVSYRYVRATVSAVVGTVVVKMASETPDSDAIPAVFSRLGTDIVVRPPGFEWVPFAISRVAGAVRTTFNIELYRNVGGSALWVKSTGNDSTGNGAWATPYRSIWKALQALSGPGQTIYVETGEYNRMYGWKGESPAYDVNVVAWGGAVVSSTEWENGATPASWTNLSGAAWRGTRSSCMRVIDKKYLDAYGVPKKMAQVATQEECIATAGTYWIDSTGVTIHLSDGRAPDAYVCVLMNVANGYTANVASRVFCDGITFMGGAYAAFKVSLPSAATTARLAFRGCVFSWAGGHTSQDADGLGAVGMPMTITQGCVAHSNIADGFSYHSANGVKSYAMEMFNIGFGNGTPDGVDNDQGSTAHEDVEVVSVGCLYFENYGAGTKDVGSARRWGVDGYARDSRAVSGTQQSGGGWVAINNAVQYLDGCKAGPGLTSDVWKEETALQYVRNGEFSSLRPRY